MTRGEIAITQLWVYERRSYKVAVSPSRSLICWAAFLITNLDTIKVEFHLRLRRMRSCLFLEVRSLVERKNDKLEH